jgi:hypothetical protein
MYFVPLRYHYGAGQRFFVNLAIYCTGKLYRFVYTYTVHIFVSIIKPVKSLSK